MKSVGEISREYGVPVSSINSAIETGLLDAIAQESGPRRIDEWSEKFRVWIDARLQQSRVKGEAGHMRELAEYACTQHIRIGFGVPDRYGILEPLDMLFSILESCPNELDFAQAASVGEIARVTGCGMDAASEYVGLFYASIGGNQADQYAVTRLLQRRTQLRSAYIQFYRE